MCFNFLVTGANFGNKGAQSMLFVTVSELAKRFPSCRIYFYTNSSYPEEDYTFTRLSPSRSQLKFLMEDLTAAKMLIKFMIKDTAKIILGRKNLQAKIHLDLRKIMSSMSAVIDISGFSVGSKWGDKLPQAYITRLQLARKYNIPVYIMPQSFGPFDYSPEVMHEIKNILGELLQYPRIIFPREKEGYDYLKNIFDLKQLQLSSDLVLQNRGIDTESIFTVPPAVSVPKISVSQGQEPAGIIPNMRCFDHADKDKLTELYCSLIDYISAQGYKIVLFRHSFEDLEICRMLKGFYPDNDNVVLIENDFNCLEYSEFVKQFKFLICSRYHGIVHAYKNNIPCIALGWAVKYNELAGNLGQGDYVFDITGGNLRTSEILDALSRLLMNYDKERASIHENLMRIQAHNCFDIVEEDFRRLKHED